MKTPAGTPIFPLNVYQALMRRHAGRAPFLCYGELGYGELGYEELAPEDKSLDQAGIAERLLAAQQRRVTRIVQAAGVCLQELAADRPAHRPLRVLEVGSGSGELARQLCAPGVEVVALELCPSLPKVKADSADIAANQPHYVTGDFADTGANADRALGIGTRFQRGEGFDLLIFNNSARYFLPLTLFHRCLSLLQANGQLLICEEFARTGDHVAPDPLPVLEHVLALAQRAGFELRSQQDLTAGSAGFQHLFAQFFRRDLAQLSTLCDVPLPGLEQLNASIVDDLQAALQGRRSHVLLTLRLNADPSASAQASSAQTPSAQTPSAQMPDFQSGRPGTLKVCSASELPPAAFQAVFEASFGVEFSPALWAWKYHTGKAASVAAERGSVVVAHYGGIVRDIVYLGQPSRAVQICDVMVMPGERSFFSRQSLFFKTAASMLEQYVGYHAQNLLGFGFPNLKAMHVAQRLGLYDKTDELMQLSVSADENAACSADQPAWQLRQNSFAALRAQADVLWQAMYPGFADAIIGVRDAAYLDYRYLQRPDLQYDCLSVHDGAGQLRALAFTRAHGDSRLLMDIVAAPADLPQALHTVMRGQSDATHSAPCLFWVTAGQLHRILAAGFTFNSAPTGIQIPCNRWTRGPAAAELDGRWWLTAGDMDFL